jgi:DNA-binding transcriptional regulator/RsmH inhibitor MraZ
MSGVRIDHQFIQGRVSGLLKRASEIESLRAPVNLALLARMQRVKIIDVRPMIPLGCIEAYEDGFRMFIRGRKLQSFEVHDRLVLDCLTPRQRFTVAHEIGHTFFFDPSAGHPEVLKRLPPVQAIERLCQDAAGRMLLPGQLLAPFLDTEQPVDPPLVLKIAREFRCSAEAVMRRLDQIEEAKRPYAGLILAKQEDSQTDATILAFCWDPSTMRTAIPAQPKEYGKLAPLLGASLDAEFWSAQQWQQENQLKEGRLRLTKVGHPGVSGLFFVQLDVATLQKLGAENSTREQKGSPPARDNPPTYDVFICHAGEDKEYVQQLATACKKAGISVWYDRSCLDWGDDLRCAIDEGLACSRFGIVVLSPAFLRKKKWTEHELSGLFAKERASQRVILPVWHNITQDQLVAYSPSLAMRLAKDSSKDAVAEMVESLQRKLHPGKAGRSSAASSGEDSIAE